MGIYLFIALLAFGIWAWWNSSQGGQAAKRTPPILRGDMLQPVDAPITTAEAKRVFKEWMVQIGHLDKQEVGDHVKYFADAMKEHEGDLKMEADHEKELAKDEFAEEKEYLKEAKRELAKCNDEARKAELQAEIKDSEEMIARMTASLAEHDKALDAFKKDKREFLVNYINEQVHGHNWQASPSH